MSKSSSYSSVVLICSETKYFPVILLSFSIANWYFSKAQNEKSNSRACVLNSDNFPVGMVAGAVTAAAEEC